MRSISLSLSVSALVAVFLSAGAVAQARSAVGESPSSPNHIVRVVTVSEDGLQRGANGSNLLQPTLKRLDQAAASFHPDIACLPELFDSETGPAESIPGPTTRRLAMWARKHHSYIIFGLKNKRDGLAFNSAILIDRQGKIVGTYDKMHPTEGEIQDGRTPGEEEHPPVFKTDFGTIGIQICYDVNWRKDWRRLKEEGAEIVFFPAAYPAALQLQALALRNEYFVVSSPGEGPAHIYDITGRVLATSGRYQEWAAAVIPIGERLFEVDYNIAKAHEIEQKYGSKVEVHWYPYSDWFTLASLDPNLTVEQLMKQYSMNPLDTYIAQATKVIDQARVEAEAKTQALK
ncbi:MAG: carbon-nitrogen hydrolase family protein [Terriglobia bacterium]